MERFFARVQTSISLIEFVLSTTTFYAMDFWNSHAAKILRILCMYNKCTKNHYVKQFILYNFINNSIKQQVYYNKNIVL